MNHEPTRDWSPDDYEKFRSQRLRPAFDLLSRVPGLPVGAVVDLGCGSGSVGASLKRRYPKHRLIGVDASASMLRKAKYTGAYDEISEADARSWKPASPPALIYSNGLFHRIPNHDSLIAKLARSLTPGGTLAVQMPRQDEAASHAMLRVTAEALFPDRFDFSNWATPVSQASHYMRLLDPLGLVNVWETEYILKLDPSKFGHPVTKHTETTAMRPFLEKLTDTERVQFMVTYDAAMKDAYPVSPDGTSILPFRRIFIVLTV